VRYCVCSVGQLQHKRTSEHDAVVTLCQERPHLPRKVLHKLGDLTDNTNGAQRSLFADVSVRAPGKETQRLGGELAVGSLELAPP
jgi:hypothetical protein